MKGVNSVIEKDYELLSILKTMIEDTGDTDDTLFTYLSIARSKIICRAFPYAKPTDCLAVPEKYRFLQCEIAAYLLNKRGGEGETAHRENGINRTWPTADIPKDMLSQIVPYCGVIV